MADFSPEALAIWNAFLDKWEWEVSQCELDAVAAALAAAADQVELLPLGAVALTVEDMVEQQIRRKLLAIAAELRGQDQQKQED